MISQKENILRFYGHIKPDYFPDLSYLHTLIGYGFLERPLEPEVVQRLGLHPERYAQYEVSREDWFGVQYVYEPGIGGSMPDVRKPHVLTDVTRWREQVKFPELDAYDWDVAAEFDNVGKVDRKNKAFSLLVQCGIFERFHSLAGMENALVAMVEEPEACDGLLCAIAEHKLRLFEKIIKHYKPDILRQHDDYGAQTALQMSPDMWQRFIKPHIKRFVALCHDNGVYYEQHSCGLVEHIVPDLVEVGVDSWQGMHINDVEKLKRFTGCRLNYHMSLDIQRYYAQDLAGKLDEDQLRKYVRDTVLPCSDGGNYFPVLATADPNWWGYGIMKDELDECAKIIKY